MVEFTSKQIHWAISPADVLTLRFRDSLKQFCLMVASFRSVTPQLPKKHRDGEGDSDDDFNGNSYQSLALRRFQSSL